MSVGFFDAISGGKAAGWAYTSADGPAVVEILHGAIVVGETIADMYREDLKYAGYGNGFHGWSFVIPENILPNCHLLEARVKSDGHILKNNTMEGARRHKENFLNSIYRGMPDTECAFNSRKVNENDEIIATEIIEIYKRSEDYQSEPGSIWDIHSETGGKEFKDLLELADVTKVAQYLCDLPMAEAAHGFLQGRQASADLMSVPLQSLGTIEAPTKDLLVSFAQYLTILNLECAELGPLGEVIHHDQKDLARQIEQAIGFPLPAPPVFNGLLGLVLNSGLLNRRSVQAIYLAHRAFSIAGSSKCHMCEIGGGVGMAAYYAMMFGSASYTLVDLPIMALFQYYFTRSALPATRVTYVLTEEEDMSDTDGINIIPANLFHKLNERWAWDLIINCDSFPEMGDRVCEEYFESFKRRSARLFSINQETNGPLTRNINGPKQTVVSHKLRQRNDYQMMFRYKSWIRHGYAEELYNISSR